MCSLFMLGNLLQVCALTQCNVANIVNSLAQDEDEPCPVYLRHATLRLSHLARLLFAHLAPQRQPTGAIILLHHFPS